MPIGDAMAKRYSGQCKSNINNLSSPFGFWLMRYKSVWCVKILIYARDVLEQKTMLDLYNQNETIFHSHNHSHRLKLCVSEKKWKCDGVTVFGRCKAEMRRLPGVKRYMKRYTKMYEMRLI